MGQFCFYKGDDSQIIRKLREAADYCWGEIAELSLNSFRLFVPADDRLDGCSSTESAIGFINGYVRSDSVGNAPPARRVDKVRHNDSFVQEVTAGKWPLGDDWTGSFAAVAYSESKAEVTLCNDIIGHLPLYYSGIAKDLIGGTSLIVLGRTLGSEIDPVGVLQRITSPYCNYGRRTLLKDVFRLMPGERLKWSNPRTGFRSDFDKSLCSGLIDSGLRATARKVWDCLQVEINAAIGDSDSVGMAMSGGWDSRLILGGIAHRGRSVKCFTYGSEDHYETKVARRCAIAIGAAHECFPIEDNYFPSRQDLEPLIRETESGNYMEWFSIIDKGRKNGEKIPLLLGDLCESIDGRYITTFSSRRARVRSFLRGLSGRGDSFNPATINNFDQWVEVKKEEIVARILANRSHLSDDLVSKTSEHNIRTEIEADLELSFARVLDNMPPFKEMFDELFTWFHQIRYLLGSQITWLGSAFHPLSPGMSIRFLRLITKIHPRLRLRKRLINAMMRLPEFDGLASIPSAQIPFIPSRAPNLIKEVLWGTRSTLDKALIKRTLKKRNNGRQRVLRSLDYVREYQAESADLNVRSWFFGQHVKSEGYLKILRDRAKLDAWTLINVDIAAPANVSIVLDLCRPQNSPD